MQYGSAGEVQANQLNDLDDQSQRNEIVFAIVVRQQERLALEMPATELKTMCCRSAVGRGAKYCDSASSNVVAWATDKSRLISTMAGKKQQGREGWKYEGSVLKLQQTSHEENERK